jgi:hypothetical protein
VERLAIGVDANPKTRSKFRRADREESVELMKTSGANHLHLVPVWTDIEPRPGDFETDEVAFLLQKSRPLPVAFNLRILDAGSRSGPDEYKTLAWDSAQMIERITQVIDQLAPVLGDRPWSYALGNEVDLYFSQRPAEIGAYGRMLQRVRARILQHHPRARLTVSFGFGATAQLRSLYAPIVAALDHVAFTYYPLGFDFRVRGPASLATDLPTMIAAAQPRRVFLQEIGYPSSTLIGSSDEQQRAFVQLAFEAIRAAGSSRVLGATYLFQADLPEAAVAEIVRAYGTNSEAFRAFVTTLGLRDDRDRPKPAWDEFKRQAALIGPSRPQQ